MKTLDFALTDSQYYEDGRSCFLYKSAPHFRTKCAAEWAHTALLISRPSQTVWHGDYPSNLRLKLIKDGPFRTKSVRELFV